MYKWLACRGFFSGRKDVHLDPHIPKKVKTNVTMAWIDI